MRLGRLREGGGTPIQFLYWALKELRYANQSGRATTTQTYTPAHKVGTPEWIRAAER